jgi:polyisoprenyl-teichoic acid--peptidoglycan teichoic acid transferase
MTKTGKRKIYWGRLLIVLAVFLLLIGSVVTALGYFYIMWRLDGIKNTSVIIMGIDGSAEVGHQHSDSLMVASVMMDQDKVELLSVPRDSYVYIPCYLNGVEDKITHSNLGDGGPKCVIKTLQKLLNLPEDNYYVAIDFQKMMQLVDDIGGISFKPTASFCQTGLDHKNYCFEKGVEVNADGMMALAYSRHRKSDNDMMRAQRQQEIILVMLKKIKTMSIFDTYQLINRVLQLVDTNLDLVHMAAFYQLSKKEDFVINRSIIKGHDDYIYSPGTGAEQYMYVIDNTWLNNYLKKIGNKTP